MEERMNGQTNESKLSFTTPPLPTADTGRNPLVGQTALVVPGSGWKSCVCVCVCGYLSIGATSCGIEIGHTYLKDILTEIYVPNLEQIWISISLFGHAMK